ncbi:protein-tyrosine phosphatase [Paenibacillus sp. UNCCL117]|uniref:tyrosine-protein phosphatase n=1 Tax=unclassified Paenibacillus TaxID=185978 RepID=UPI00088546B6|nr:MULTISPECIES: CpsB/CapC family capsule biosynthesis tyrosine phosphatase [unclassified Paenibacillus]SDC03942.1 protein-tyrosine phosphatase [Paenibacillus sp. cl123]SFW37210.1 protein-tyrosine phosphatase [Paenibacillus sp. UNCCL117]
MIDIHTHILPGIDDGAASEEQAVRMAQAAEQEGIRTLIATPHHANGKYSNPGLHIRQDVETLIRLFSARGVSVDVLPGQEIRIHRELLEELQEGVAIGLHDTPYLLLELPSSDVPAYTEEMIHELRILGHTPIIAHPERNAVLAADSDRLSRLIEAGALSQLTSHSVNGAYGRKLQKLCLEWCGQGLAQFISSDAHNLEHRAFGLKQAYSLIAQECGGTLSAYLSDNAHRLLQHEEIKFLTMPQAGRKRWWKIW